MDIKERVIKWVQVLKFRLLWYQLNQDERREWLQDLRYKVWRSSQNANNFVEEC
jgi:hypothetical protein